MPAAGGDADPGGATERRYGGGSAWTDERRARDGAPPPPGYGSGEGGAGAAAAGAAAGAAAVVGWPAPPRSFPEAIEVCLRKYVDFKGRASRSEYWYFILFTSILGAVAAAISESVEFAVNLAVFLPTIAAGTRRLHDIGRSGLNQLWFLLPIIGWIIIIVRLARVGDSGPNAYG